MIIPLTGKRLSPPGTLTSSDNKNNAKETRELPNYSRIFTAQTNDWHGSPPLLCALKQRAAPSKYIVEIDKDTWIVI